MEHPAEVLFSRANARCEMEHPVGQISIQRAPSVYSATKACFSAPIFSPHVGDALTRLVQK
jgi:hypothetical protein